SLEPRLGGRNGAVRGGLMPAEGESDKREVGSPPMPKCIGREVDGGDRDKKRAPSEDGALRKWWQTDEGGGNAVCRWTLPREEDSARSVSVICGTAGGGCGAASQRQVEYEGSQGFQQ